MPGLRAVREEWVRVPPAGKPSAREALGWPVYVVARPDVDAVSVALLETRLSAGGFTGPVTWVSGEVDLATTPWGPLGFTVEGSRANLGLTIAHVYVMMLVGEGTSPAWVLEDDVVLHDRFPQLFPEYWADPRVTPDFEYVSVGGVPAVPGGIPDTVEGIPRVDVGPKQWGTQSYILSPSGAQRFARVFDRMIALAKGLQGGVGREEGGKTLLPPADVVVDGLQAHVWTLMDDSERHRILTFLSPPDAPAEVHGFRWRTPAKDDVFLSFTGVNLGNRAVRAIELSHEGALKGDCRRPPACECDRAFMGYFTSGLTFQSGCVPYHTDVHNTWARFVEACGQGVAQRCLDLWECQFRSGRTCGLP
jgi:GR25 family glycosyltransferase involved in LPS biosynthesis